MGLFGRKKVATASRAGTTVSMTGWGTECGPKCGFIVRSPDQKDATAALLHHMKFVHKTTLTQQEGLAALQPRTWDAPDA